MATTYTPNYHLGKQTDPNDNFDMSVITANMDTIDAQMKTNADNIATAQQSIDDLSPVLTQILNTVGGIEQTTNTINTNVTDIKNGIGDTAEILELILSGYQGASSKVNFYDYDGSVLYSYTKDEFLALTEMPSNPSHEGLTSQGWNWSLSDAKTYVNKYGTLNIGQMYVTDDGKTRIYITLSGIVKPLLQLYLNNNTTLDIDWGDGSTHSTFTTTSANYVSERHDYSAPGDYVIAISVTTGSFVLQSSSTYVSSILWNGNNNEISPDTAYNLAIKKVEIGTGTNGVGRTAFSNCRSLTSVTIPNAMIYIDTNAFQNCYSLTSITIPNGVTNIGQQAFYNCYSLTSVTIPNTVMYISNAAFNSCTVLTSITIPDLVTIINKQVFQFCYSLTSITIPDTVTSIGQDAFSNCYSLTSITIPDTVIGISKSAFTACYALTSITIPDGVPGIGDSIFQNCYSLKSITIPDTVTGIGQLAFAGCYTLTSITIPDGVTSIGTYAFNSCYLISSITIPDTVTSIGDYVFRFCYALSSVTIGSGVTSIGQQTFSGCYSLTSITIPDNVTSIGQQAFTNCKSLESIKFTSTTPPTVANSDAWTGVPTTCKIYVPSGTIETYKAATNYPNPSTYTYIEY